MSKVKVAFQAIVALLESNKDKRVRDLLPEVIELASAKQGGGGGARSFHKVDDVVVAAKCGYFGLWFPVGADVEGAVEFGAKASSASGLNTMCKAGTSEWTKQNSAYKTSRDQLLTSVAAGEVEPADMQTKLKEIEDAKNARSEAPATGYETLEAVLAALGIEQEAA